VAVRPPSSDSTNNPYNLRSRSKLKTNTSNTEVIPSFTEKLSLETSSSPLSSQQKPVPPLTRAAAASAGVKIDFPLTSFVVPDEQTKSSSCSSHNLSSSSKLPVAITPTLNSQSTVLTRSSATRKRKASEDDHRPYLDLLKMKQTQSTYSFDGNSPKKMTRRADQDCIGADDEDSGCDYDSPAHSPVDFTDVPPGHVLHFEESNMSYDSGFSTGSGEPHHHHQQQQRSSSDSHLESPSGTGITTRSSTMAQSSSSKYPAAIDLDVNAIEGDLGF
jgi:hypothetical protein